MRKKKVKEKQCTRCGEVKPLDNFYMGGNRQPKSCCKQCELRIMRERYRRMHPLGVTYDRETGKAWRRTGRGRRIEWTAQMLSDLRRLFRETFHDWDKKIPAKELFDWHHRLTGSCMQGRIAFCEAHGLDWMNGEYSVNEFIELTKDAYGGEIIRRLAE